MCHKAHESIIVTTIFKVDEINTPDKEMKRLSDLDPQIPKEEVQAHPVEDLIPYQLDPEHSERIVMFGSRLNQDT